ncbi:hypothetical protein BDP27DRAFT_1335264 [Rhodocollybia butyracea]|uniref:Uncharacterized protein n=1 Tax=Rhodocollybia butyracea TaxID=206335 RepID=A0A9P5U338_9AGAR|nr:hypothetical protein BDP27DRAFT_1335264 [Rhodocollybia butyracea]
MALTQTATIPGPGPSWDEQVVPALRKRLESESRTLARRISAISMSSAETADSPAALTIQNSTSSSSGRPGSRSRTYSQPYSHQNNRRSDTSKASSSSRPTSPPNKASQSRIPLPQRSRSRTESMTGRIKSPAPGEVPPADLWVVHERPSHSRLVNEPAPFPPPGSSASSVDGVPEPRQSTDSEERPFEHWYRGEVSRNGGVGEYRVAKRQEMLEIANYGHSRKPNPITDTIDTARRRRGRPRADSLGERTSFYLDENQAQDAERVLDEDPLTDVDGEHEEYYDPMEEYYRPGSTEPDNETSHRTTTPTPTNVQRPSRIPRSTTPTQMQRGQSEPPYFPASIGESTSTSSSAPATPRILPSGSKPQSQSQNRARGASPAGGSSSTSSKGKPKSSASPSPSSNSRMAASKATQAKLAQNKRQKEREEEHRRSIAAYPDPGDDLMNAIPTWTQPIPKAGNWDDVVLPVVARKKGLNGHYEQADGRIQTKKDEIPIAPAPGTFGFDHSKYRPPRNLDGAESIPMDEFGTRNSRERNGEVDEDEPYDQNPRTETAHDQIRSQTKTVHPGYPQPPSSPLPFAEYPPMPSNGRVEEPPPMSQMKADMDVERGRSGEDEEHGKGGCCGCVIM